MKTKVNTKKKISTKPKSKPLKQGAVSGSLQNDSFKKAVIKLMKAVHKHHPMINAETEIDLYTGYWVVFELLKQ